MQGGAWRGGSKPGLVSVSRGRIGPGAGVATRKLAGKAPREVGRFAALLFVGAEAPTDDASCVSRGGFISWLKARAAKRGESGSDCGVNARSWTSKIGTSAAKAALGLCG
jgi:hypothetical protein